MSNWSNIVNHEIESLTPYGYHFGGFNKDTEFYPMQNERGYLLAYNMCSPLRSVITDRSKSFNNGILKVVDEEDVDVTNNEVNKLLKLLNKPNQIQTQKQFFTQQNQYIDIFGYAIVLKMKAVGFSNVTSLWNIPNWLVQINYKNNYLIAGKIEDAIDSINFIYGDDKNIELEDLIFIYDEGIGTDINFRQNIYFPDSRIKSLEYPINNIIAAYKARNTLITSKGALGILSHNAPVDSMKTLQPKEVEQVQNDFKKYGITGQDYQVVITDANLKWQAMSYPTKDLMLFEEIEDDISRIIDMYDWDRDLMSREKGSTFANKKEAKKYVFESTIIPESKSRLEQISLHFLSTELSLIRDYSHLYIFQEDLMAKSRAYKTVNEALKIAFEAGAITIEEWKEKLLKYE